MRYAWPLILLGLSLVPNQTAFARICQDTFAGPSHRIAVADELPWDILTERTRECLRKIPRDYLEHPGFFLLAYDPADQKISPKSVREAMAGIEAIREGLIRAPIVRGPKEVEFYDASGQAWDVKAPQIFGTDRAVRSKSYRDVAASFKKKFRIPAVRIIFDTTWLSVDEYLTIREHLEDILTADELGRIVEISLREIGVN